MWFMLAYAGLVALLTLVAQRLTMALLWEWRVKSRQSRTRK